MTGFGKVTVELPTKKAIIEIKSLNSKQLDLTSRISPAYRDKDILIRNELLQALERGKVEIVITTEITEKEASAKINLPIFESYYEQVKTIAKKLNLSEPDNWFQTLLRMPEVVKTDLSETDAAEWEAVHQGLQEAIAQLIEYRMKEGAMLEQLFVQKIATIAGLLQQVEPYENERIDRIKARISENRMKLADIEYDAGRLEQEMFYYIEKLDINEEKSRLDYHLKYFIDTLGNGSGQGKKLGFITQEIGREINTLGSKSNHVEIQKIVVQMKDELEQIKEQILNVL
jgi:uncharacterized protein (TIGR00255 family)